jgi:uncharacterized protein
MGTITEMQLDDQMNAVTEDLMERLFSQPLCQKDIDVVQAQLGRYPRGMVAVGARCVCGRPLAVVTRPQLQDGTPFPTTFYLTSPGAVRAISRLEAEGAMKEYARLVEDDDDVHAGYERAHRLYLSFRHALAQRLGDNEDHILGISAGGLPKRVKCLHALTAQTLVMGEGVNPIGDMVLKRVVKEFSPSVCRCSSSMLS